MFFFYLFFCCKGIYVCNKNVCILKKNKKALPFIKKNKKIKGSKKKTLTFRSTVHRQMNVSVQTKQNTHTSSNYTHIYTHAVSQHACS